ncbi:hypothetical protein PLICRDRAFT_44735 [Plicaturopsis crispa FD-325 SS-3]|nr:hypothetical protein PLICRDRAFT_44735 [Plicaturopsis crispa FD-325 SS-3]
MTFDVLFSLVPLSKSPGGLVLKNRLAMSAMTRNRAVGNLPNQLMAEHYAQRARGGVSLIASEGVIISSQGSEWANVPGIWNAEQAAEWEKITDAVHKEGSLIFCQLWHFGRLINTNAQEYKTDKKPIYAPSAIPARDTDAGRFQRLTGTSYATPVAIEDPTVLIEEFKAAAIHAKNASFDGIELQAGGGYLPHQFLDKSSNVRTDKWGGSAENRCRFTLETLAAVISVFGADRVGIKVQPGGGLNDVGMSLDDSLETYTYLFEEMDKLGLAYVEVFINSDALEQIIDGKPRSTRFDLLGTFRPKIKNSLLFVNGIGDMPLEDATSLITDGKVDVLAYGRKWINNPDFANRVKKGLPLDTVPLDFGSFYGWKKDPAEHYTDVVPVGGFATV